MKQCRGVTSRKVLITAFVTQVALVFLTFTVYTYFGNFDNSSVWTKYGFSVPDTKTKNSSHWITCQQNYSNWSSPVDGEPPPLSLSRLKTPEFLANFKNPSWKNGTSGAKFCLPYFYIAGFPKCGTTDLYYRLIAHPLIKYAKVKEPHYVSRKTFVKKCPHSLETEDSSNCRIYQYSKGYFNVATKAIFRNKVSCGWIPQAITALGTNFKFGTRVHCNFADEMGAFCFFYDAGGKSKNTPIDNRVRNKKCRKFRGLAKKKFDHPLITVDGSASTFWDFQNWDKIEENQGCGHPNYLPIDFVLKINPHAKFVVILREPVARLYSDYIYFTELLKSAEDFHNLTINFISKFEECLISKSLYQCVHQALDFSNNYPSVRLHIGLYHVYVREWFRRIPRERILFLTTESYGANMTKELQRVFNFLDLPDTDPALLNLILQETKRNRNQEAKKEIGPMLTETKQILTKFYADHNQKLADLLGDKIFLWQN